MNDTIFFFFYYLAHQAAFFDGLIVFFAVYLPYVAVILAGLFLLFHHEILKIEEPLKVLWEKKREFLFIFSSVFLSYFFSVILKVIFHTSRPFLALTNVQALFNESSFAFPSGHATFFSALAFSLFFLHKKAGYIFMSIALLIGLARIAAGVHFPIDILGGFILGGVTAYLIKCFTKIA